uniref:Uncharacterized protein n=1 Tax=Arundo donax TaxID=35708 RepID=A0A0A9BH37_ARUDO
MIMILAASIFHARIVLIKNSTWSMHHVLCN